MPPHPPRRSCLLRWAAPKTSLLWVYRVGISAVHLLYRESPCPILRVEEFGENLELKKSLLLLSSSETHGQGNLSGQDW